jgi:DnaJ-class molecular chaperone
MAETNEQTEENTKDCPKCEGKGRYHDLNRLLVQVTCEECGGSGKVPA